jgi:hypothetical protein
MLNITGTLVCEIDGDTQIWDDDGLYGVEVNEQNEAVGVFPLNEVNRYWVEPHLVAIGVSFPED